MSTFLSGENLTLVLKIVLSLLGLALAVLPYLRRMADASDTTRRREAANFLIALAQTVVQDAMKEVGEMKDPKTASVWDEHAQQRLKQRGIAFVKRLGAKELEIVLGAAAKSNGTLDDYAAKLVEAQVQAANGAAPRISVVPPPAQVVAVPVPSAAPPPAGEGG